MHLHFVEGSRSTWQWYVRQARDKLGFPMAPILITTSSQEEELEGAVVLIVLSAHQRPKRMRLRSEAAARTRWKTITLWRLWGNPNLTFPFIGADYSFCSYLLNLLPVLTSIPFSRLITTYPPLSLSLSISFSFTEANQILKITITCTMPDHAQN